MIQKGNVNGVTADWHNLNASASVVCRTSVINSSSRSTTSRRSLEKIKRLKGGIVVQEETAQSLGLYGYEQVGRTGNEAARLAALLAPQANQLSDHY